MRDMISELRITDPDNTCIKWWPQVAWLKGRESIPFEPGLNILWGPNGSGKSTIMKCIARMLHAEQSTITCPTHHSMQDLFETFGRDGDREGYKDGAVPIHDGEAIMHFDPMHAVGLSAGSSAFDDDFFMAGIGSAMFRGSSGQTTLQRLDGLLSAVITRKWPEIDWSKARDLPSKLTELPPKNTTDRYDHQRDLDRKSWLVTQTLRGTLPKGGPRTILLDEPDRSLDLPYQWGLWHRLSQEKGVQMIIASHSLVALRIPGANYIELGPGDYLTRSERVLDLVLERAIVTMPGLPKSTIIDVLKNVTSRMKDKGESPRDPRIDPQEGDVVRIPWKGAMQIRLVTERLVSPSGTHKVRWRHYDPDKAGNVVSLTGWQKLTEGGTVLRVGPE